MIKCQIFVIVPVLSINSKRKETKEKLRHKMLMKAKLIWKIFEKFLPEIAKEVSHGVGYFLLTYIKNY